MNNPRNLFNALPNLLGMSLIVLAGLMLSGCKGGLESGGGTIAITPASVQIAIGQTLNFTATRIYADGTAADVTSRVTWASSSTATATINSAGLATGVAVGNTSITASLGGVTSSAAALQVKTPTAITIAPAAVSVGVGLTTSFAATHLNPAGVADLANPITSQVVWASSNTAIATISATGVATGVAAGSATITASSGGVTSNVATLTVSPWTMTITPTTATSYIGSTTSYTATRNNVGGTTTNITSSVTWSSSNTAIATISAAGVATGVAAGSATITASLSGVTSNTSALTVSSVDPMTGTSWSGTWATVTDTTVPNTPMPVLKAATIGNSASTSAIKTVTVTTAGNLTFYYKVSSEAGWDKLNFYIDNVLKTSSWSGTVAWTLATFPITAGTHTLTWTYTKDSTDTGFTGSDTAWISQLTLPKALTAIAITPTTASVAAGGKQQFTATATYSDASVVALGNSAVTWSSSNALAASVNTAGLASALSMGTTNIGASSGVIVAPTIAMTVTAPVVVGTQMGGSRQGTALTLATAVTTLAGSGTAGSLDSTAGILATFSGPSSIATDGTNLYVADTTSNKIRKIVISTGAVTTVAGSGVAGSADATGTLATFNSPYGITTDGANLYVADTASNKIRKIVISTGAVTTLAGSGTAGSADNATGTLATFNGPYGITTDGANLYVAERWNNKIRKIVISTGAVTTVAGSGTAGSADGTGTLATFSGPFGITTDGVYLYVADTTNNKIRKIVIGTGVVTTVAGSGVAGSLDNPTGTLATFWNPYGITTDGINLYVADSLNQKIRKIVISTGAVATVAGSGVAGSAADNTTGTSATFWNPYGITADGIDLYVVDRSNNKIRRIQ